MRLLLSTFTPALVALPLLGQAQERTPGQTPEEKAHVPAPSQPRPALRVGDGLPPVLIEELSQTRARSFSEFYGRVVLLEFFAYWCAPCAQSVPHLNKLQAKYGARGLSVLAVTTDASKKTLPWIEKHGIEYAWGRDPSGELHRLFQVQAIPFAALIDSFGMVAWTGDPRRLREETIESALVDALPQPVWEWPEEALPLAGLLERADFATALREVEKVPAREGFDPEALVRGRIAPLVARFEALVDGQDYSAAFKLGERLEKGLATLPEGTKLKARLEVLRSDPEITRSVSAEASVTMMEARIGALRKPADAQQLRDEVAAFLDSKPPEKFERRAKILLDTLERGLAKVGKKPQ
jgi:peroxiredoxin